MKFLHKTGVAVRLIAALPLLALLGCETLENWEAEPIRGGANILESKIGSNIELPACDPPTLTSLCEMFEIKLWMPNLLGRDPTSPEYDEGRGATHIWELGEQGTPNGLALIEEEQIPIALGCLKNGELIASFQYPASPLINSSPPRSSAEIETSIRRYMQYRPGSPLYNHATVARDSAADVVKACEFIRLKMAQQSNKRVNLRVEKAVILQEQAAEQRLEACDSFGFERGTEAHAECAMKLYMNEQNQGASAPPARTDTSSSDQQLAAIARQQAIQEATIKEQKRIQELEASLRMMQFGIDLMNGTSTPRRSSQTHSQTYSINGQIIRCTTTGSITTCL